MFAPHVAVLRVECVCMHSHGATRWKKKESSAKLDAEFSVTKRSRAGDEVHAVDETETAFISTRYNSSPQQPVMAR